MKIQYIRLIIFISFFVFISELSNAEVVYNIFNKPRKNYDSNLLNIGTFDLDFSLNANYLKTNNVYATRDNTKSDSIRILNPKLNMESNWSKHKFYAGADGKFGFYDKYHDEDYKDYTLNTGGRLDILRDANFEIDAKHSRLHEERSSPDDSSGIEPTKYYLTEFSSKLNLWETKRFKTGIEGNSKIYDYENNYKEESGTGQKILIHNSYRNRTENTAKTRFTYQFKPPYSVFTEGSYNQRDYKTNKQITDSGTTYLVRDSEGYDVKIGGRIDITGKLDAEGYFAYIDQNYESNELEDVDGYYGGGSLLWNINDMTSLKIGTDRKIVETTIQDASSYLSDKYYAEIEHELRRYLLLSLKYAETNENYQFKTNDNYREDDIIQYSGLIRYYIHRYIFLEGNYSRTEKDSSDYDSNYTENIWSISLNYKI